MDSCWMNEEYLRNKEETSQYAWEICRFSKKSNYENESWRMADFWSSQEWEAGVKVGSRFQRGWHGERLRHGARHGGCSSVPLPEASYVSERQGPFPISPAQSLSTLFLGQGWAKSRLLWNNANYHLDLWFKKKKNSNFLLYGVLKYARQSRE